MVEKQEAKTAPRPDKFLLRKSKNWLKHELYKKSAELKGSARTINQILLSWLQE